jgi:hypothetical protein
VYSNMFSRPVVRMVFRGRRKRAESDGFLALLPRRPRQSEKGALTSTSEIVWKIFVSPRGALSLGSKFRNLTHTFLCKRPDELYRRALRSRTGY